MIDWNSDQGYSGTVPASSSTGWSFKVTLEVGTNVITVSGTNTAGLVRTDSVTIVRDEEVQVYAISINFLRGTETHRAHESQTCCASEADRPDLIRRRLTRT